MKIEQVYLMVDDLGASVEFYGSALNLDCVNRGERSATFDTGTCQLKVEQTFEEKTLAEFGLSSPGDNRGDGVVIVLGVSDVQAVYDHARTAGVDPLIEPRRVEWGRILTLVEDPDGYVVEISEPV